MTRRMSIVREDMHFLFNEHGKNGFAEVSKNLAKYMSEDDFVGPSK